MHTYQAEVSLPGLMNLEAYMFRQTRQHLRNNRVLPALIGAGILLAHVQAIAQYDRHRSRRSGTSEKKLEPEQQIRRTRDPQKLLALGKQFLQENEREHAIQCIERAVDRDSELLTDTKRVSPPEWNKLWFLERARIRMEHLRRSDAEGRMEVATWLKDAGFYHQARKTLISALAADPDNETARELAYEWNIAYSGIVEFDFTLALDHALLVDSYQDQGVEIKGSDNQQFLIVPIAFNPGERRMRLNKNHLRVSTDNDDRCSVRGIVLLEKTESRRSYSGRGQTPPTRKYELSMQKENEPLWEMIRVNPPRRGRDEKKQQKDTDEYDLICTNSYPPRISRRNRNVKISGQLGSETKTGSGYAAFIVEVPGNAREFTCEYRHDKTIQLTRDFLENVQYPTENLTMLQKQQLSRVLLPYLENEKVEPAVAETVAYKLAAVRTGDNQKKSRGYGRDENQLEVINPIDMEIEQTLLKAMRYENLRIQQAAFKALALSPAKLSRSLSDHIRSSAEPELLLNLLRQIESALMRAQREQGQRRHYYRQDKESPLAVALEPLPPSPQTPNLFKILNACLQSSTEEVHARALTVALQDGTRTSIRSLATAPPPVQKLVQQRFSGLNDPTLQATVLRVALIQANPQVAIALLNAAQGLSVEIRNIQDPFLQTLVKRQHLGLAENLLRYLQNCDFSEISEEPEFAELLYQLANQYSSAPRVSNAMVKLAMAKFQQPYQAPLEFGNKSRRGRRRNLRRNVGNQEKMDSSLRNLPAFETFLALVAAGEDQQSAYEAARLLVKSGRLEALNVILSTRAKPERVQNLIQSLSSEQALRNLESLPVFLVHRFRDENLQIVGLALQATNDLLTVPDIQQRCRLRIAFKEAAPLEEWAELSVHKDERIARVATQALARLADLSPEMLQEISQQKSDRMRVQLLQQRSEQLQEPRGIYTCFVYADITPVEDLNENRRGSRTRKRSRTKDTPKKKEAEKPSIWGMLAEAASGNKATSGQITPASIVKRVAFPLYSSQVGFEMQDGNLLKVTQDDQLVAILKNALSREEGRRRRGRSRRGSSASLQLGVATQSILRKALTSKQAKEAGIVGHVGLEEGYQGLTCTVDHLTLGTWIGEIEALGKSRRIDTDFGKPLVLRKAVVVLEPMYPSR
jgi:hypothetical protein